MITKKNSWLYCGLIILFMCLSACSFDEDDATQSNLAEDMAGEGDSIYKLLLAEAYYYNGEDALAADYYLKALKETEDGYIAERAVALAIQTKKYDQALTAASYWQDFDAASTDLNQYLVLLYQEKNQLENSAKALDALVEQLNKTAKPGLDIGMALLGQSVNKKQIYNILKIYTALYNDTPEARYYEALLAHQAELHSEALQIIEMLLAMKKGDKADKKEIMQKALLLKVGILMKLDKEEQAVKVLNELIEQAAGTQTKQNYARLMASLGKPAQAVKLLQQVYEEQPDNVALLRDIIAIYFDNKEYKATLPLIDVLEEKEDHAFVALYFRGMAFEALEQYDNALASYKAIKPNEHEGITAIEIQTRIAIVLEKHKSLRHALKYVREQQKKSQADNTSLSELYMLESDLYHTDKQYGKALLMNKRAAELLPKNSNILYSQALLYEALKDLPSSEKVLKSILVFDKNNSNAMNALGYLLTDQTTRFDEALVYIKAAYRLQPRDPMIIDSLGWVHFKMGNIKKAETYLRQAYKLRPDVEIAAHLIELLAKKGADNEAKTLLQEMLKNNPDNEVLLRLKQKL